MNTPNMPDDMIQQPDGSWISLSKLDPVKQLEHELVVAMFEKADRLHTSLAEFKSHCLDELPGHREILFEKYEAKVGGAGGNMTRRSVCGRFMIKLIISKHVSFGPELEAAKALIDEFLGKELDGSSDPIREIVTKVFKINSKGRVDTHGILGLREHRFNDPLWEKAIIAIEAAIRRDSSSTYVHFFHVDPESGEETRLPLDFAKV